MDMFCHPVKSKVYSNMPMTMRVGLAIKAIMTLTLAGIFDLLVAWLFTILIVLEYCSREYAMNERAVAPRKTNTAYLCLEAALYTI